MVEAGPEEVPLVDPVPSEYEVSIAVLDAVDERKMQSTEHASHGASVVAYLSQIGEPKRVSLLKRSKVACSNCIVSSHLDVSFYTCGLLS